MPSDLIDRELGPYRIESVLGRGRDSTVYVAISSRDRRHYALKILDRAGDPDGRLLRQLVMALDDPHVVKIYDYGDHEGTPWLVRELVVGRSLDDVLRETPRLGQADAVDLAVQVIAGLQAYHANGMTHGALRPSNILLTDSLLVRLCDPCVRAGAPHPDDAEWCAPEVLAGAAVGPPSDQYSLGAILHRALTGRGLAADAPHWSGQDALDPVLVAAVERMLASDPAGRFPSYAACLDGLRPVARAAGAPARSAPTAPGSGSAIAPVILPQFAAAVAAAAAAPKTGRMASRSQAQRSVAAAKRIDEALDAAEQAFAGKDLDAAAAHAERANTMAATLALGVSPAQTERIVGMRSRIAAARKEQPKKPWYKLFG